MDRRDFLTAKRKKTPAASQQASRNITSGINPYSGPWTENEIVHLLKRTMFGAKKADVDYFRSLTARFNHKEEVLIRNGGQAL